MRGAGLLSGLARPGGVSEAGVRARLKGCQPPWEARLPCLCIALSFKGQLILASLLLDQLRFVRGPYAVTENLHVCGTKR